jgi:hypothetical protein
VPAQRALAPHTCRNPTATEWQQKQASGCTTEHAGDCHCTDTHSRTTSSATQVHKQWSSLHEPNISAKRAARTSKCAHQRMVAVTETTTLNQRYRRAVAYPWANRRRWAHRCAAIRILTTTLIPRDPAVSSINVQMHQQPLLLHMIMGLLCKKKNASQMSTSSSCSSLIANGAREPPQRVKTPAQAVILRYRRAVVHHKQRIASAQAEVIAARASDLPLQGARSAVRTGKCAQRIMMAIIEATAPNRRMAAQRTIAALEPMPPRGARSALRAPLHQPHC